MKKKKVKKVKKRNTRAVRKENEEKVVEGSALKVVTVIIAVAVAIFITFSNFSLCGSVGDMIRNVILSAFGTLGYFFPIFIVVAVIISLYNSRKVASFKTYSLITLYIMLICLIETNIHDFDIETQLSSAIHDAIMSARGRISFEAKNFSAGIIGTSISYVLYKAIGKAGALTFFGAASIISFIFLFGLGISKIIIKILKAIILFIPNMIKYFITKKQEDDQIAIDNENILKETIEKSKKTNLSVALRDANDIGSRLVLEPLPEKKTFDTSRINISSDDVRSHFYQVNEEEVEEKNRLLREMKKKSINEIMYEKKDVNPSSFFYTDGMKPIDQMENITIPEPKIEMPVVEAEEEVETDIKTTYDDTKNFASGLADVREPGDTLDYKNKTSHEILENTTRDIEVKNNIIKNEELSPPISRKRRQRKYKFPPSTLLKKSEKKASARDPQLNDKANILVETLKQFGVGVSVTNITVGPSVTRFELKPDLGVKVSKILALEDDVKLALEATDIRIEAPIPGKPAIGIEIPNKESSGVYLGDIIATNEFRNAESRLTVAIGKDISGKIITTDLRKMPHLLIAGATGSGKSVCINAIITSLIYKSSPEDVRLLMVDPKVVELQVYDGIPHLLIPVVTNPKKASAALNWAVNEMTRRYNLIQEKRVRDIESYNHVIEGEINKISVNENNEAELEALQKLPYIVIIIDEFADLMMVASKEVENSIMRIAQLARACGIYLVIATQRPSVNVISGSIKTNVPSRISFAVASGVDSQTILDRRGAEKLLGHGDMLYFPQGIPEPVRVQGCYVSENEILDIVNYVKDTEVDYDIEAETAIEKGASSSDSSGYDPNEKDELFVEAGKLIIEQQSASIGMLQRRFRMGFNRAARVMDQLEAEGVISRQDGKKPREVLMTLEEFLEKEG